MAMGAEGLEGQGQAVRCGGRDCVLSPVFRLRRGVDFLGKSGQWQGLTHGLAGQFGELCESAPGQLRKPQRGHGMSAPECLQAVLPPHSIEAEQDVLGALLDGGDAAWDDVASLLSDADFYRDDHRRIFRMIRSLHESAHPVDVLTVADALAASNEEPDGRLGLPGRAGEFGGFGGSCTPSGGGDPRQGATPPADDGRAGDRAAGADGGIGQCGDGAAGRGWFWMQISRARAAVSRGIFRRWWVGRSGDRCPHGCG